MKILDPFIAVLIFHSISLQSDLPVVDQPMVQPAKEIVNTIFSQQFFSISTHVIGNDYSVGIMFKPEVAGEVTKLRTLIPQEGTFTVSLWDVDNQTLLVKTNIHQDAEEWSEVAIPSQLLEANRTYALTVLLPIGTRYYNISELDLPATVCGVQVLTSVAAYGDSYPVDLRMPDALFGLIDFTFAATVQQPLSSIF